MYAVELEQQAGGKRRVAIRQHGAVGWKSLDENVTANEFKLLRVLFDEGLQVPEPIYLDCSGSILKSPYLVTDYIDGTTSVDHYMLDSCLQQMATYLSRLHRLDTDSMALPKLPVIEDPVQGTLQYLPRVSEDKKLLSSIGMMTADTEIQRLLHGDFWPGNILWHNGHLVAVVDWEDAALGNPMSDLACCRVELLCEYGRDAMDTFTKYYLQNNSFDTVDLELWQVYASSSALSTMHEWGLAPEDEAHRREMTEVFLQESISRL